MQKLSRSLFALGVLAGLAACGDDVSVTEPPPVTPAVTGISVTPPSATLAIGGTAQLSAVVTANDPSVALTVTWSTSAASVATVSATGLVTAVGRGSATITATSTANANFKAGAQITVEGGVRSVTVSPTNAIVLTGQTLQLVANVDANAGVARTVTWTSSTPAVATVSTAGVVTGVAQGTASIIARSTVDTSITGAAAITVRNPIPATISISNITTGTLQTPVNENNVFGQIEVTLNVDPGDQVISSVEVLLDGQVACGQAFSSVSRNEELRLAAVFASVQAAPVTCSINTAVFDAATGAVKYFNGLRQISARANVTGAAQVVTPSKPLTFNNVSGVVMSVSNDNGADAETATNPGQGLSWMGGSLTVTALGVSYVSGVTITSVTLGNFGGGAFLGKTANNVITLTGTTAPSGFVGGGSSGTKTYSEGTSAWSATDNDLAGYQTAVTITIPPNPAVIGEAPVVAATLLSNGQNGPANTLNFAGSPTGNAAIPPVPIVRVDNVAPGATSANGVVQTAITLSPAAVWVNATTSLAAASGTTVNALGIPGLGTLNAVTTGTDIEEGVDAITVSVYTTPAATALPTTGGACNVTGLNLVTTGNQLTETTVSTAFRTRVVFKDALGNSTCMDLATTFGADFTAPTATITGPVANTGYDAVPGLNWAITASDNASGFSATPTSVDMSRLNASGTTSCVVKTNGTCTGGSTTFRGLTFSSTDGSTTEGYYTTSITVQDQAGNQVVLVTSQLNGFDVTNPTFTGGISLPSLIAGAQTNTFTATVGDNLDLGSVFGDVPYPGGNVLRYPSQSVGTFGPALEQTASVSYAVADWIRCLNPPNNFATASNLPIGIILTVSDQMTIAQNLTSLPSLPFGPNAQPCTNAAGFGVGNILAADILSFNQSAPNYGSGLNQVDIDGASLATTSSTSVTLSTIANVALNSSADPFSRVDYYYQSGGVWRKIGTATAVLAQTQTQRTYTYTFVWDPDASVPAGALTVAAIGVDAQGDAVFSTPQTVTTVP